MKILQIAYYYPPMGGAGVQRALKFSKYLPEFGVEPLVLAGLDPSYVGDASLSAEIPASLTVHRVTHKPLLQRLMAWRARHARRAGPTADGTPAAAQTGNRRWRDRVLSAYAALQFPDEKGMWARRALREARVLLSAEPVDLIFSSAPPMSTHWVAARLSREFGLPWVADFRDLWTDGPGYSAPGWRRAIDKRLEAKWLRQASGVVTVTPSWQALLAERLGAACPVAFIPNGYDEADFAGLAPHSADPAVFRLVHTGTFYGPRDPATLLESIALYLQDPAPGAPALRLRLIGNMGSRFGARLAAFDQQYPGVVERVAYLPHRQALAEMMAADALLLVVGAGHGKTNAAVVAGTLPGKIFEYLRAAKPVLLLGDEEGDAAHLLRQHGRGWIANEMQPQRIAQALRAMMDAATAGTLESAMVLPTDFERRELAGQLARFLAQCRDRFHART